MSTDDTPIRLPYLSTDDDSLWTVAELVLLLARGEIDFDPRWVDYQDSKVPGHECTLSLLLRYVALSGDDGRESMRAALVLGIARLLAEIDRLDHAAPGACSRGDAMLRRLAGDSEFSIATHKAIERAYGSPDAERQSRAAGIHRQLRSVNGVDATPLVSAIEVRDLFDAAEVCSLHAATLAKPIALDRYPDNLREVMAEAEADRPAKHAEWVLRTERVRRVAERLQMLI